MHCSRHIQANGPNNDNTSNSFPGTPLGRGKPPKVWILQSSERDQSETKQDIPLKSETTHNEPLEEDWTRTRSLNQLLDADKTNKGRSVNKQKQQGKEKKMVGQKRLEGMRRSVFPGNQGWIRIL